VVAEGAPNTLPGNPASVTGPWMTAATRPLRPRRPHAPGGTLTLRGASLHTLKDVTVEFPLGSLTVVTGVSGSGKSSLILGTLAPWLRSKVEGTPAPAVPLRGLDGTHGIERVVMVDARPLGRSPRSVPASAVGLLAELRTLFAAMPEAKARGFNAARFSFNLKGGRCERCQGAGVIRVGMDFLPDVAVPCDLCDGARYEPETLQVKFRGWSIADLLAMTVDEAIPVLEAIPKARDLLLGLRDVGLGYLRLGQPVTTLSGGEAQRVRLATELSRRGRLRTVYLLDEPTSGLHPSDVDVLMTLLERLVAEGNTVICVEHHLDVVARADHVIELGPGGGEAGGRVVAAAAPAALAAMDTPTAPFLARRMGVARGA
jgi:excinuclease ABC subunit A